MPVSTRSQSAKRFDDDVKLILFIMKTLLEYNLALHRLNSMKPTKKNLKQQQAILKNRKVIQLNIGYIFDSNPYGVATYLSTISCNPTLFWHFLSKTNVECFFEKITSFESVSKNFATGTFFTCSA